MDTAAILEAIDAEIRRLEQAKTLLNGARPGKRIRPAKPGKRTMSAEAREKIAAAQRAAVGAGREVKRVCLPRIMVNPWQTGQAQKRLQPSQGGITEAYRY
jgi:hypothetical protein